MDTYALINTLAAGPDQDRWTIIRLRRNKTVERLEFTGTRDDAQAMVDRMNAAVRAAVDAARRDN